jgi:hypothetical protein
VHDDEGDKDEDDEVHDDLPELMDWSNDTDDEDKGDDDMQNKDDEDNDNV